jgi:hypothetical protein
MAHPAAPGRDTASETRLNRAGQQCRTGEMVATPRIGRERFGALTDDDAVQQVRLDAMQFREADRKKARTTAA